MTLSTGLFRRLDSDTGDEPLVKRLKLAENVFYSSDLPIVRKEDHIFRWFCDQLSKEDKPEIWKTIHRCLALEPNSFNRLSPETKNMLIDRLILILNEYANIAVLEDIVKCCTYIFSNTFSSNYLKDKKIIKLIETALKFTIKIISSNESQELNKFIKSDLVIECAEHAVSAFAQMCKQNYFEKSNCILLFIHELLFPLAFLIEVTKKQNICCKVDMETQKCVKRLLLGPIRSTASISDEKIEKDQDSDIIFSSLTTKAAAEKRANVIVVFTFLFKTAVTTFPQNTALLHMILRKLVQCNERKDQAKQVLTSLIENSIDVPYNFDHEIEGIALKTFFKSKIEDIISKKKCLKCLDYQLLCAIIKLNPLFIEDTIQIILERILFENKLSEDEERAYENLVKELWIASVRLRKQQNFLSEFFLALKSYQEKNIENLELKNKFELPKVFLDKFCQDLKERTTNVQILAMFQSLNIYLKSDCVSESTYGLPRGCLMIKVITKFFVVFLQHSNFLDTTLPYDWKIQFFKLLRDLRNILVLFTEKLCESNDKHEAIIFIACLNLIKVWCQAYDLLSYYEPSILDNGLEFPVNEIQLKQLKYITKTYKDKDSEKLLNHLILLKYIIFKKDDLQPFKEKIITQLWQVVLEYHFGLIECFDEIQILKLSLHLIHEATSTEDNLIKWISFVKRNISKFTEKFTTSILLQIISNLQNEIENCATKNIIKKIDFENLLKSLSTFELLRKTLKSANKEIAKQDFKPLGVVNIEKVTRNLIFLSNLPLSFLNTNIRTLLFMVLYTFEEEIKNSANLKEIFNNLYLDILRQSDVDVFNYISKPTIFLHHFKDSPTILVKIYKVSLNNLSALTFWEDYINIEEYSRKIKCILLTCIDSTKSKVYANEHKSVLHNLSWKLSSKILSELNEKINDPDEIIGLRISLKNLLSAKKKIKSNLKKSISLIFKTMFQNIESVIDSRLIQEGLQFSLVVLSHREHFEISEETIKNLCIILIRNPDGIIFSQFLEVLMDSEFKNFAKTLNHQTKESLVNGDKEVLEKVTVTWESLSKVETKVIRSKWFCSEVNQLFNDLLSLETKGIPSVLLIRICQAITVSKRMLRLTERMVDVIFVMLMESLKNVSQETTLIACQKALKLCLDFVRSKTEFLLDKLPIFTSIFRKIIQLILNKAKKENFSDEQMLKILAVDIEKYCTFFAKLKKDVARISPYLIADLIEATSNVGVLPTFLKISLDSSICQLLTNCDEYAISFLSRTLSMPTQQIFKSIYKNYIKYHKYTGKM